MPIYTVTAITGRFSPAQKQRLATAITELHCAATGTLRHLVQVVFHEVAAGDVFVAGKPLQYDNIAIVGLVRGGVRAEARKALILDMMHSAAAIAETDRSSVQIYIAELPARNIAEWGRLSGAPDDDASSDPVAAAQLQERIRSLNG